MKLKKRLCSVVLALVAALSLSAVPLQATPPTTPSYISNYQMVWCQDFTAMTTLSQAGIVPGYTLGSGTWISHTPNHKDWFTFIDPSGDNNPFGIANGALTIRVAKRGYGDPNNWFSGYSGGLISSIDQNGAGFKQKYGYFETSMQTPGGPNTWPSFWLLGVNSVTSPTSNYAEIDVTESYGNYNSGPNQSPPGNPNYTHAGWINWGPNGAILSYGGNWNLIPGLSTGFHTYGVDIEPDFITYYVDRVQVYQTPTYTTAQDYMYVLANLALGGASYNNPTGTGYNWNLTPDPSDLKIKYIAVWASPNSPNYTGATAPGAPSGLAATAGNAQVALSWAASSGATSYNVYRGTTAGGESTTAIITGLTGTAYTNTGLTNGTAYYYKVKAVNGSGTSAYSNEATATPVAPAGGTVVISDDFSQPNFDSGSHTPYSVYGVRIWNGGPGSTGLVPNNGTTPGNTVLGANLPGGSWKFAGGANADYDASEIGNTAGYGASNIKLTGGTAFVPYATLHNNENIGISLAGYNTATQLTVSVYVYPKNDPAYVGFDSALAVANNFSGLKVDTSGGVSLIVNDAQVGSTIPFVGTFSTTTASLLTFTVNTSTGAISGISLQGSTASYSFSTSAFTPAATAYAALKAPAGAGYAIFAYYKIQSSAAGSPPPAPTGLAATSGNAQIVLSWAASSGATSYNVYRGTTAGGESTTAVATGITATSYTNTELTNGTAYYYKVKAVNASGIGAYSNEAFATPAASGSGTVVIYDDFSQPNIDNGSHTPYNIYSVRMWDGAPGSAGLPPNNGTTPGSTVLGTNLPGGVWKFGGGANYDYDAIEVGNTAGYGASNIKLTGGTDFVPYASLHNNENVAISLAGHNTANQLTVSVYVCPQSNPCYVGFDSALNVANNFSGLKVDTAGGVSLIVNGAQVGTTTAFTGTFSSSTAQLLTFTVNTSTGAISGISLQGSTSTYAFSTSAFTAAATAYGALATPAGGYGIFAYYKVTH